MADITHIFSSLVPPRGHTGEPVEIHSANLPLEGALYGMLSNVYIKSDAECTTAVQFILATDGSQNNEVRAAFIELVGSPDLAKVEALAVRLSAVTPGKAGLGLLFFVIGKEGDQHKLLVSRFPATQGILAEAQTHGLAVEFVEKVFMRNAATYKAALYRSAAPAAEYWDGTVVDKQSASMGESAASYWLRGFLKSDLKTTSKAGSRMLAAAFRKAAQACTSLDDKHQLISAITLIARLTDQPIPARDIFDRFGLAPDLQQAVISQLPNDESADATFMLDPGEFNRIAGLRTVKLDSGAILTAATDDFENVFTREVVDQNESMVRYSTTGRITDETVKAS